MKSKISLLFFMFLGILLIIGCGPKKKKQPMKIGLCMDSYVQQRWKKDKDLFVSKIKEHKGNVIVKVANGDANVQIQNAKELINANVTVLVIVPVNLESAGEIVKLAHQYGVKVISYDRLIRNCELDYYISFDNVKIGELQAEYMTKRKPIGNYALIGGAVTDYNSISIKLGQMNVLQPFVEKGDVKIVFDEFVNLWLEEEGERLMEKCLKQTNNNIDVVLAANDGLATGAIKVLRKYGLARKVLVAGQDADLEACRNIVDEDQTITIYKPIGAIAATAAEAAINLSNGKELTNANLTINNGHKLVPSILLQPIIVNKETIKLTVIADGYYTKSEIYDVELNND